jgi:hypothetical protein
LKGGKGERGGWGRKKTDISGVSVLKNDRDEMMGFKMYIIVRGEGK